MMYLYQINSSDNSQHHYQYFSQEQNEISDTVDSCDPQNITREGLEGLFPAGTKVASVYSWKERKKKQIRQDARDLEKR